MTRQEIEAAAAIAYAQFKAEMPSVPESQWTESDAMIAQAMFMFGVEWQIERTTARLEARIKAMQEEG